MGRHSLARQFRGTKSLSKVSPDTGSFFCSHIHHPAPQEVTSGLCHLSPAEHETLSPPRACHPILGILASTLRSFIFLILGLQIQMPKGPGRHKSK